MNTARYALGQAMEKLCGPDKIPDRERTKISRLAHRLNLEICEDLGVSMVPGCLTEVPDDAVLTDRTAQTISDIGQAIAHAESQAA